MCLLLPDFLFYALFSRLLVFFRSLIFIIFTKKSVILHNNSKHASRLKAKI